MKIYLIRHGETDWNVQGKIQGSKNIKLNSKGIIQAEQLSEKIVDLQYSFSKIYSSPQERAVQTAEILSRTTGINYIIRNGLQEIDLGEWEGRSWSEVQEIYPRGYEQLIQ
ncbi:histidine phosphatase family protein [Niallia sp. FSL W8-1348]|uniref:histidine phosphatase family protein n=1 Tax=Niallia sp. FSL W8-1348 TaxID=2954656 RepID=UPI0030F7F160